MLGHGCEGLPFMLYRLDYMHKAGVRSQRYPRLKPLQHDLFHYMRNNVLATNSGLPFGPAIKTMIEVMGEDRVMYAMDYPYQYVPDEVRWMDDLDITASAEEEVLPDQRRALVQAVAAAHKGSGTRGRDGDHRQCRRKSPRGWLRCAGRSLWSQARA